MPTDLQTYAVLHTSPLPPLLQEILDYTERHHKHAHMISGHLQGQLLRQLSVMLRPRRILEIGTFTGFSALCLAEGLPEDGRLYTLELRSEDAAIAAGYFARSPLGNKINLLTGDARAIVPTLPECWDLVFIDADKTGYVDYYEMVMPQLRSGGFILADNVLFHGEVLADEVKGKNAKAILAFNTHVMQDERTEKVLMTVRDGLLLLRKK